MTNFVYNKPGRARKINLESLPVMFFVCGKESRSTLSRFTFFVVTTVKSASLMEHEEIANAAATSTPKSIDEYFICLLLPAFVKQHVCLLEPLC